MLYQERPTYGSARQHIKLSGFGTQSPSDHGLFTDLTTGNMVLNVWVILSNFTLGCLGLFSKVNKLIIAYLHVQPQLRTERVLDEKVSTRKKGEANALELDFMLKKRDGFKKFGKQCITIKSTSGYSMLFCV